MGPEAIPQSTTTREGEISSSREGWIIGWGALAMGGGHAFVMTLDSPKRGDGDNDSPGSHHHHFDPVQGMCLTEACSRKDGWVSGGSSSCCTWIQRQLSHWPYLCAVPFAKRDGLTANLGSCRTASLP